MDLAERLKIKRKKLGLSQTALAEAVGVSQPTIANWESGGHTPRRAALSRIAKALDTDPSWLLSGELPARLNPAHRHLAKPIHHIPVYDWPEGGADPASGQPARYTTTSERVGDAFALNAIPSLGFPPGTVLVFDRASEELPGRFLVQQPGGLSLEVRHSLDDVLARLIYSVVPH